MSVRYLLDTNICIYIHRERPVSVLARFKRLKPGEAAISVITWGELMFGAAKSASGEQVTQALEAFTGLVPVAPLHSGVGRAYGEIRAELQKRGTPIGNNDLWIAAHAKAMGWTLVSNNTREFERVKGLKLANWA